MSTWAETISYIKSQLRPGVLGVTDVQKILNAILAVSSQFNAGELNPQPGALWDAATPYGQDVDPVLWRDTWLVSNIPGNIGNVPISNTGVVHPTWRVVSSSPGTGLRVWQSMVYPNELEVVFQSGVLYYLDREIVDGPFHSVDFAAELLDGKWKLLNIGGMGNVGPGLSVDVDGKIQFGDGLGINYTPATVVDDGFGGLTASYDGNLNVNGTIDWYFENELFEADSVNYQGTTGGSTPIFITGGYSSALDQDHFVYMGKRVSELEASFELFGYTNPSGGPYHSAFVVGEAELDRAKLSLFIEGDAGATGIYMNSTVTGSVVGIRVEDDIDQVGFVYNADYEANFVARSLVTKQYVDGLVTGADPYGDYLTFNEGIDLWQVGFENDYLQFFEGIFSVVINTSTAMSFSETQISWMIATGGLNIDSDGFTLEEGNGKFIYDGVADYFIWQLGAAGNQMILDFDTVNSRLDFLSSAPVTAYNFDKPVLVNGEPAGLGEIDVIDLIGEEVPNPSTQFFTDPILNVTRFVHKWVDRPTSYPDAFIVTFDANYRVGGYSDPNYFFLDQEIGDIDPVEGNEVLMWHSSHVIPSIITLNPYGWTITGTYLAGTSNINLLHFTYKVDGTIKLDIYQKSGANTDPSIPDLALAVNLLLNETDTIVANFPLVDSGYFDVDARIKNINNTVNATRTALGGIYFYNLGIGSTNAERSWIEIPEIPGLEQTNSFTFFIELKTTTPNGSTSIELLNNQELALADGTGNIRIYTNGSGGEIWVQIGAYTSNAGDGNSAFQVRSNSSFGGIQGFGWCRIAVTFDNDNVKIYKEVAGVMTDIVTTADDGNSKLAGKKVNNGNPFLIGRRKDSTTINREYDVKVVKLWNVALSLSDIQTMVTALPS